MTHQSLVEYIIKTAEMGFEKEEIEKKLFEAGHSVSDVKKAMQSALPSKEGPKKKHKKIKTSNLTYIVLTVFIIIIIGSAAFYIMSIKQKIIPYERPNCDKLPGKERDWCTFRLATQEQSVTLCDSITDKPILDFCYSVILGDQFDCDKLSDQVQAEQCKTGS